MEGKLMDIFSHYLCTPHYPLSSIYAATHLWRGWLMYQLHPEVVEVMLAFLKLNQLLEPPLLLMSLVTETTI